MPSAPHDLSISAARAGALFASPPQRSGERSASQVQRAIAAAIGVHDVQDCAARVAQSAMPTPRIFWFISGSAANAETPPP
jgi:hypothetical protein